MYKVLRRDGDRLVSVFQKEELEETYWKDDKPVVVKKWILFCNTTEC
jgi:hypothetical protein